MGGYRKGFQPECPGEITNLQKFAFDATTDEGPDDRWPTS